MFWDNADDLVRILVVAPAAYVALIVLLRVSGKRMLSKMSAFDLVVTIALGSILATILLSKDVSLSEGLTALALLLAMQFVVAWSAARSETITRVLKSEPRLLYYDGSFLRDAMRSENVSEEAVRAGMRQHGFASLSEVQAVVLESDGSLSIVGQPHADGVSTVAHLRGVRDADRKP